MIRTIKPTLAALMAAASLVAMSCSQDHETGNVTAVQRLKLDVVIGQEIAHDFPTAQYRTLSELHEVEDAELRNSRLLEEDAHLLWVLEQVVGWIMNDGSHTRTEEFRTVERRTRELFWQRVVDCARDNVPTVEVGDLQLPSPEDVGELQDPAYTMAAQQLGLTPTGLVDLRYECSQDALDLTDPDSDEFATLLDKLHDLHTAGVEAWLQQYPIEELLDNDLPIDLLP